MPSTTSHFLTVLVTFLASRKTRLAIPVLLKLIFMNGVEQMQQLFGVLKQKNFLDL